MKREITFNIFRFNSEFDILPSRSQFTLEISRGEVVLDALERIKAEIDPALAYRRSCRHGICGSCAVKVENRAVLACKANIWHLADQYGETLRVDPLDARFAARDLIVDKTPFWEKYHAVSPWLEAPIDPSPRKEYLVPPIAADRLDGADGCVECGACYYSCPVIGENSAFLGPAAIVKSYRFAVDIRDLRDRRLGEIGGAGGIWECVKCYMCEAVCPKEISPIDKITKLRELGFAKDKAKDTIATRHAVAFKTSIEKYGRLDEAANIRHSLGVFGTLAHWREAVAMLRRGKLRFTTPAIEKLDEVQKLVKTASRSSK